MRKLIVFMDNSKYTGCSAADILEVPSGTSEEEINEIAFEMACEHAGSYFEVVEEEDYDGEDEYIHVSDIDFHWEDYVPEKHDCFRTGGGSFADDFSE